MTKSVNLQNGADDVADGAKDLYDAIKKINENPQMNPMMNPLNEGAETLYKRSKDLREAVYDVTDEYLEVEWQNLISITPKDKNARIGDYRDFMATNKYYALPIGVALFLSLAF